MSNGADSKARRQLCRVCAACVQVWLILPCSSTGGLGDLLNSPPDFCSTRRTPSPNRQHRQGTNSEICQAAQPTLHALLTKMIKFSAETQTRMAISRATASLSCASCPHCWSPWPGQGEQVQRGPEQSHPQTPSTPAGAAGAGAGAGPRFSNIPAGCSQAGCQDVLTPEGKW